MSKMKLMGGLATAVFLWVVVPAMALGSNQLIITNKETGTTDLVTIVPKTIATTTVATTTSATSTPVVVATTTGTSTCVNYLTNFHGYGSQGEEVVKLQNFLNAYNGSKLNGKGFYGPATVREVKNLQYTYGIKVTGVQHEKTTALINNLNCGNILKREPVKFVASTAYTTNPNGQAVVIASGNTKSGGEIKNVYPNPTPAQIPAVGTDPKVNYGDKGYTQPKTGKGLTSPKATTTENLVSTTTKPSFIENLKQDYQKIKDNYKAYVLVFVLVLALFWFLRKAATE